MNLRLGAAGLVILAPFTTAMAADGAVAQPTYSKDIAPIFNAHCVACHRPNQIAPMSLMGYDEVRPWAKSIRNMVSERKMPPWHASDDSLSFKNRNTLTPEQVATIETWVDQGARRGNPSELPPVPEFSDEGWTIGEPDAVFTMDAPITLPDDEDDYQPEVVIEKTLTEDTWISKVEVMPGNRQLVHHALVFIVPPDADQSGRGRGALTMGELVGIYAPGTPPFEYASGTGKKFPAGHKVQLNMHYHKETGPGTEASDRSRVGMIFSDSEVNDPVTTAWLANPALNIPPNEANVKSTASFTFKDDGQILSFMPHMHYRGKDMRYTATYPDGKEELLLDVPAYDFNWQLCYVLDEPKDIPKGTVVTVVAHHDNSANNPMNPDPTRHVTWIHGLHLRHVERRTSDIPGRV